MNSISELFSEQGRQAYHEDWGIIDRLEQLLPEAVRRVQASETDIEGLAILSEMIEGVDSQKIDSNEKRILKSWLGRLRYGWLSSGGGTAAEQQGWVRQASEIGGQVEEFE
jgi:hypothetical protein